MAIDPLAAGAYVIPQAVAPVPPAVLREPGAPRLDETRERRDERNREEFGSGSGGAEARQAAAPSTSEDRGSLLDIQV